MSEDIRWKFSVGDFYVPVGNPDKWEACPKCGLVPRIWVFDSGRYAKCVCGSSKYSAAQASAESIVSHLGRTGGSAVGYSPDDLRINWNKHVAALKAARGEA